MIYVTGASGYLGSQIRQTGECYPLPRDSWRQGQGGTVIHCAAVVPKTEAEADDPVAAQTSLELLDKVLALPPRFLVFVSTRETRGVYAQAKSEGEARCLRSGVPTHIVRLPGLFGPPRTGGLVYNAARAAVTGVPFASSAVPRHWYTMPVSEAAWVCMQAALNRTPGLTVARNQAIENFLDWVRA